MTSLDLWHVQVDRVAELGRRVWEMLGCVSESDVERER